MKVNGLKKLIKEAVKEALREELALQTERTVQKKEVSKVNSLEEALSMTKSSMTNEDFQNVMSFDSSDAKSFFSKNSLNSNTEVPNPPGPQPGLDITNLDFVKNASKVLNASLEKDKKKLNGV